MTPIPEQQPFALGVVILAAGRSSRMGHPKLLLPWEGTTIIGHLIHQWRTLGALSVTMVVAQGDQALAGELDRLDVPPDRRVVNLNPDNGMFSSIQCAARDAKRGASETHFAVVLGDQPQLRSSTLRRLVKFAASRKTEVCQPSYQGRPKHPVVLSRTSFEALASSPAQTFKEALSALATSLCECEDPGLGLDIDTPSDYEHARRFISGG